MVTGAAFVDLSAAYDTVQHRLMIRKLMDMTGDIDLCQLIRGLLSNRRFFVQLNDKKSRWRSQNNGLPQGSVLAPLLFNIYTNDQPLPTDCSRFIYADDLCITTQQSDFQHVEQTLELALDEMSIYYLNNHLKPNPAKTHICCFHLGNRDAKRKLYVTWNGLELDHYPNLSLQNCFSTLNSRRPLKTDDDPCMSPALEYDYWFCCASELGPPRI